MNKIQNKVEDFIAVLWFGSSPGKSTVLKKGQEFWSQLSFLLKFLLSISCLFKRICHSKYDSFCWRNISLLRLRSLLFGFVFFFFLLGFSSCLICARSVSCEIGTWSTSLTISVICCATWRQWIRKLTNAVWKSTSGCISVQFCKKSLTTLWNIWGWWKWSFRSLTKLFWNISQVFVSQTNFPHSEENGSVILAGWSVNEREYAFVLLKSELKIYLPWIWPRQTIYINLVRSLRPSGSLRSNCFETSWG